MNREILAALLSDTVALTAAVGLLTPLLTALIEQPQFPLWLRRTVAAAVATIVGVITAATQGAFRPDAGLSWLAIIVMVVGFAQASYHELWKRTPITRTVETATVIPLRRKTTASRRRRRTAKDDAA
jgi:hypothetical protein